MGKFLLLAFRNVFRNSRRTVMTLMMVGGGVAGLLLVGGFFAFMFRGLRESTSAPALATSRSSPQNISSAMRCMCSTRASAIGGVWRLPLDRALTCAASLHASSSMACFRTA